MPSPLLFYGLSALLTALSVVADPSSGALYPPGLQPLIIRANALLSAGTFHDAVKAYSEAIGTCIHSGLKCGPKVYASVSLMRV
jgi:hypothetical protein